MERWYVVADRQASDLTDRVWTLSRDPNETGWETDSGFNGYGLPKATAEFLAAAANEKLDREAETPCVVCGGEGVLTPSTMPGGWFLFEGVEEIDCAWCDGTGQDRPAGPYPQPPTLPPEQL